MTDATFPWLRSYPANIAWDAPLPAHPMFSLLDEAEDAYGDRLAIDFLGAHTTYRQLAQQVRRMARGLRGMGVDKGVRVGLFLPNCPQFVISYYAILKAGGTVVNYNPLYSPEELLHQLDDSGTGIMVTLALKALYPKVASCLGRSALKTIIVSEFQEALPLPKRLAFPLARKADIAAYPHDANHARFSDLLASDDTPVPLAIDPHRDVALLQYTGGTTGVPKGAVLTHANLYANTLQCGLWFTGLEKGKESIVGVLPLFHVFAMATVMNLAIHTGSAMLLHPKFDMKGVLYDLHYKRPTLMPGVPTMYAAINQYRGIEKYDLKSLKMCISGGGPLPAEVKQVFEQRTGCKLIEGYGLTECSPVACANPLFGVNKSGSIGIPFPGTIMEVTDLEDPERVLGTGQTGELCVRGPQVMQGYLNQPGESERVLQQGRLRTGDIGYIDEDGYVFIVDRLKEMIISGGYNIYPRNLEEVLYTHPAVLEAAVIGIPHPQRVQVPKAFVVFKTGLSATETELRDYLRLHVAAYAVPHAIECRASLPKSAIGKILKKQLISEENARAAPVTKM